MSADSGSRWLSEGVETLVQEIEAASPDAIHCEVLIIGSGYGGAVAAARLAGARPRDGGDPISVFVLERGQEVLPGMFPATFAELPGHVRFSLQDGRPSRGRLEGVFDLRLGGDVNVLLGNGLGGGSLINAAVMEQPTADAFADSRWPAGLNLESLAADYGKAKAMLDPRPMPGSVPKLDSLFAAASAMGAQAYKAQVAVAFRDGVTPAGVAMHECLKCGDCVTGCNHQAKQSLDVNYLALARANGARLFCGTTVHRVRALGDRDGYAVEFYFTDPSKARSDREHPYVVRARRVILAAGTLGSTEILLRSQGPKLPIAPKALGSRFSGNGDLIAVAHRQKDAAHGSAREGDPPAERNVGPTITGIVRHQPPYQPRPLVFEEFAIPGPLRRLLCEVVATTSALHGLARTDRSLHAASERIDDPLAVSDEAIEHTQVYGMMGDDGAEGVIELARTPPLEPAPIDAQVRITWDSAAQSPVFAAQIEALRRAHERVGGCGGQVLPNPMWQPLPPFKVLDNPVVLGPPMTVHPLGGCPMADHKERGVVDSCGRVYAAAGGASDTLPGLAVLDGSIVPAALGINPALTIAALAERAVPALAADWGLELRASDAMQTAPRPVRRKLTQPGAPQPTTIKLQERMTGRLVISGQTFDAGAVVDFAPVDVPTLRRLPRVIKQPEVTLSFTHTDGKRTWARCEGRAAILVRERSSLQTRVLRSLDPARRKLQPWANDTTDCRWIEFIALCSHVGQVRLIRYHWTVIEAGEGAPVQPGERLLLTKRIEFTETGNPWRQLSEGRLSRVDINRTPLGRLVLDPNFFVEQLVPLLRVESQQDQPNAIGDILELALWALRIVLRIHLLNFLPPHPDNKVNASGERLPAIVAGVEPTAIPVRPPLPPHPALEQPRRQLSRYTSPSPKAGARPVLLIHGYGASGSTFAHPSIGHNLVEVLLQSGREVWVLDLRTSIGLDQRVYWSFDEVAGSDIPDAIDTVLAHSDVAGDGKVDVVAHCIGAAMFSVAALGSSRMHRKVGVAVLSQVGPLLRMTAFNRFRGFVASYLQQFFGTGQFDVSLEGVDLKRQLLIDGLLATFPYPDDDREAERLQTVPEFAAARHRADAIFGQTMQLENISDETLRSLDAIYGWVIVKGLAQTIHYARELLLTDANGANQVVAFSEIAERMNFPLLMVHGRKNALFDWRGSYDTIRLLKQVIDRVDLPPEPPPDEVIGKSTPRRLHVFDGYGHQDTLIGKHAHRDVFPHIVGFLDEFASYTPKEAHGDPPLAAELPYMGPTLGHVVRDASELVCRIVLRAPPARASTLAVAYVPARRSADGWSFMFDEAVLEALDTREDPDAQAQVVRLVADRLADYQGFAVVTLHSDLPMRRVARIGGQGVVRALFAHPSEGLPDEVREKVERALSAPPDAVDLAVVHLDPAWIDAASAPGQGARDSLTLALASCQYPPGLVDRLPAQRSLDRLARHIAHSRSGERPQALLLVGDQVYLDDTAGLFDPGAEDVERAYRLNFTLPALRRLTKSLPTYPLLDDHEVVDNWEPEKPLSEAHVRALKAYRQHQHELVDASSTPPFDYTFAPAGMPVFMLDVRSTRQRRALRVAATDAAQLDDASIHAQTKLDDLLRALQSPAHADVPKFIVSSTTVFPFPRAALAGNGAERLGLDDWSGYPRSLFMLLDFIRRHRIRNVVLLSGDRHLSSVSSLWIDDGGAPIEVVSIVSSGLYAPWPFANARADELWLDGPVKLRHAGQEIRGTVVTPLAGASDGFAIIRVERTEAGAWRIDVRLDLAGGVRSCRRTLGDASDRRWDAG